MNKYTRGFVAGLIATLALSVLMIIKMSAGLLPQLNAIQMLSGVTASLTGTQASPAVGWVLHVLIGVFLWGGLFALIEEKLPASEYWMKGVVFGIAAWVLMMLLVMPVAGAGLFGLGIGFAAPLATLILHLIYGAILGWGFSLGQADLKAVSSIVPETPAPPESPVEPANPESPLSPDQSERAGAEKPEEVSNPSAPTRNY